ncbi:MAG: UDP-N-acetylglucosamine 2-epimerase (non-hydrolyzing) [Methanomicrobiaceae archaeon]|nr:UDP-N-acetylglucosamine 2-epimerase (non-hydrolyzing) [Methanomicrobiaceae archaeon]
MIAITLGTRPEIIKMAPIIRECEQQDIDYFLIHSGQHYSFEMDQTFFDELQLPRPHYNLNAGSGTHAWQTGKIMAGVEKVLLENPPDLILVQGDTNTVLAAALAASKLQHAIGHVEAGLRCFDRRLPEEINRVVTDHISDYLFAPTTKAVGNLRDEGIDESKIHLTGNTIVDAIYQNLQISCGGYDVAQKLGLQPGEYFLVTFHRPENVDSRATFSELMNGLNAIHDEFSLPVVFPMHPRTKKQMTATGLSPGSIHSIDPVGYLEFLQLEAGARCILTDSGGIQEESCILGIPCVTVRQNTERPETLLVGANVLSNVSCAEIVKKTQEILARGSGWVNPFGDGTAARNIVNILDHSG